MNNLSLTVDKLYEKIEKLISLHQISSEENIKLNSQNKELLIKTEEQKKQIEELTRINTQIKLAKSLKESEVDTLDVKLKINELVREVDTCIAILNR